MPGICQHAHAYWYWLLPMVPTPPLDSVFWFSFRDKAKYAQPTASGSTTPSGTPPPSRTSCGKCFWRSTCSPATVCTCTRQGEIRKNSKLAINFLHNIIISKFSQLVPNLAQHFQKNSEMISEIIHSWKWKIHSPSYILKSAPWPS